MLVVDLPIVQLDTLLSGLKELNLAEVRAGNPYRSFGDSLGESRVCVDLVFVGTASSTRAAVFLGQLKRLVLTEAMVVGNKNLFTADDALILEFGSPSVLRHVRALCTEMLFLSTDKLLIRTEAAVESWVELMDRLCRDGESTVISKPRWKARRFGGRPFAKPSDICCVYRCLPALEEFRVWRGFRGDDSRRQPNSGEPRPSWPRSPGLYLRAPLPTCRVGIVYTRCGCPWPLGILAATGILGRSGRTGKAPGIPGQHTRCRMDQPPFSRPESSRCRCGLRGIGRRQGGGCV